MHHDSNSGTEKIPTQIHSHAEKASAAVAREIADLIKKRATEGRPVCWGWPLGLRLRACTRSWCGCTKSRGFPLPM